MDITCISDTHGFHEQLKMTGGDMLIHAGDISMQGRINEVVSFLNWFKKQDYTYKIFIAGNHDFFFEKLNQKEILELIPSNVTYLNDSGVSIHDIKIWGSPITPTFHNLAFNRDRGEKIKSHWKKIPLNTDILITHGPPYGILDKTFQNLNVGCEDLLKSVLDLKPKLHLFGHIHECFGRHDNNGTTFLNASVLTAEYRMRKDNFLQYLYTS